MDARERVVAGRGVMGRQRRDAEVVVATGREGGEESALVPATALKLLVRTLTSTTDGFHAQADIVRAHRVADCGSARVPLA